MASEIHGVLGQPSAFSSTTPERARRASTRTRHLASDRPWRGSLAEDSAHGRSGYLKAQLDVIGRLSARMAATVDADGIPEAVVDELHRVFGVYLAVIQRLDSDGILRVVAGAGPLGEIMQEFLLVEQPLHVGVNGRVARTGKTALVADTRLDCDYVVRDSETDPRSELAVPIIVEGRVWGVLNLEEVEAGVFDGGDATLLEAVAAQLGATLHRVRLFEQLEGAFTTTLAVLSGAVEAKDPYTADHENGVADLSIKVAARLGLGLSEQQTIRYAALLHDFGKIAVPTEILNKQGPLDDDEWAVMRNHTVMGAELLARIPFFVEVHPLVRSSHEHWDGGGYPDGLAETSIPLGARIISACDALNAMTTDRPYRRRRVLSAALRELQRCSGSQFDPTVIDALVDERA